MRLLFFSPEWGDNWSYCIHAPVVELADNEERYQTHQHNYSMNMQGVYRSNRIIFTLFINTLSPQGTSISAILFLRQMFKS